METRRERERSALLDDVLVEARRQLEAGGATALSWRAVARAVGVGASTLYTYFDGVDGLYTAVITDAFGDMARHVRGADDPDASPRKRVGAAARAYRSWALANPARFNLVFTDVVSGYDAPADGPTVAAQVELLAPLAEAVAAALGRRSTDLTTWSRVDRHRALGLWGAIHGHVVLEVNHHLDWVDDRDGLFDRSVETAFAALD